MDDNTTPDPEKPTSDITMTRRKFLGSSLAAAAVGATAGATVIDKLSENRSQKESIEAMIRDMVGASTGQSELTHRYSVREILKTIQPLDVFPLSPTTPEEIQKKRAATLNFQIENKSYSNRFSMPYQKGTALDAIIAGRSVQDPTDRKEGLDISDLVKGLLEAGAVPTEQTIRLLEQRIKQSTAMQASQSRILSSNLTNYDWKQDVKVMESLKQPLMLAKYNNRAANSPAR